MTGLANNRTDGRRLIRLAGEVVMSFVNFAAREIIFKLVYHGPAFSGKSTNFRYLEAKFCPNARPGRHDYRTSEERTRFLEFAPSSLPLIQGLRARFHLYTLPGAVFFEENRRILLQGADGIVFVADSQSERLDDDLESLDRLRDALFHYGTALTEVPWVLQYNKQDLPSALPLEELDRELNPTNRPSFAAVATEGKGLLEPLQICAKLAVSRLRQRLLPHTLREPPCP